MALFCEIATCAVNKSATTGWSASALRNHRWCAYRGRHSISIQNEHIQSIVPFGNLFNLYNFLFHRLKALTVAKSGNKGRNARGKWDDSRTKAVETIDVGAKKSGIVISTPF
jgi:hypothetical protein